MQASQFILKKICLQQQKYKMENIKKISENFLVYVDFAAFTFD